MKIVDNLVTSTPIQKFLYNHGYIRQEEVTKNVLANVIPDAGYRQAFLSVINELQDTATYQNPSIASQKIRLLNEITEKGFHDANPSNKTKALDYLHNITPAGYQPAGSVLKRLYPNPFAPYAFLADNYWASDKARGEMRIEIQRDGYVLIAEDRTAKKKLKFVNDMLNELQIPLFWVDWADKLNTYGNFWNLWDRNWIGGVRTDIYSLLAERILPIYDRWTDQIIAWEYQIKGRRIIFPLDEIDHVMTYSARSNQLGSPALSSVLVEIEADMHATIYNNNVMQKGGLIKGILALKNPDDGAVINDQVSMEYAEKVQNLINKRYSGVRGAAQLFAQFGVENYFDLNKIGEIDGIYQKSSDRTASRAAMLHGVPPERIGLMHSSQYQNNALTADSISLSMDNRQYYMTHLVAKYINERILRDKFGIEDVTIQAAGEFGSVSKTAADFGVQISAMGADIMTVNEFRMKVLHWEPIQGPEGDVYIGDFLRQAKPGAVQKAVGPISSRQLNYGGKTFIKWKPIDIQHLE